MGPRASVLSRQFKNSLLRKGLTLDKIEGREKDLEWQDVKNMITKQDGPWPPPVLTHGDLNPFNILVRGDKVVGLIDWESSGWYPHYWEYTSTWLTSVTMTEWRGLLEKFIDPVSDELKMEETGNKWWGE